MIVTVLNRTCNILVVEHVYIRFSKMVINFILTEVFT